MSSVPSKKRKIDDGNDKVVHYTSGSFISSWFGYITRLFMTGRRVDPSSENHSNDIFMQQTLSHLKSMTQMMRKMEEKIAQLETKFSSLDNMLESKCDSLEN